MTDKSNEEARSGLSRRSVLQKSAAGAAIVATGTVASAEARGNAGGVGKVRTGHPILGDKANKRRADAMFVRLQGAQTASSPNLGKQKTNGDEGLYADKRGSYSKGLPHNALGEVDPGAYQQLLTALKSEKNSDFELIPLGGDRKLANPQGAYKFEMVGRDSHATYMRPAPSFASLETAAEMGELYWKALCRDIPFANYSFDPLIAAAVADLNAMSETVGPKIDGAVSSDTIFRGETAGDLSGPYISQLLLKDIPYGNGQIVQKYVTPAPSDDFMTDTASWLAVQNGVSPVPLSKNNPRYISDARALGEFVHVDFSYQSYLSAALILLGMPGSLDPNNPYLGSTTQGAFISLGGPEILDLVAKAGGLALTGAWYQKWLVHRRARPEVYAGRLHNQAIGAKDYDLPDEILNSDGVSRTFWKNGTRFLPMAFPEGSPTHPAYPAGHATIAGACATVLKAVFNEDAPIVNPVVSDAAGATLMSYTGTLTIGGEINKLANNIALGRDWAGVHYRSDGVDGLLVGEQQAIGMLRDYTRVHNETHDGFMLTTFEGNAIVIKDGKVL